MGPGRPVEFGRSRGTPGLVEVNALRSGKSHHFKFQLGDDEPRPIDKAEFDGVSVGKLRCWPKVGRESLVETAPFLSIPAREPVH